MKLSQITKILIGLSLSLLLSGALAFNPLWKTPINGLGELTWNTVIEQSLSWIFPTFFMTLLVSQSLLQNQKNIPLTRMLSLLFFIFISGLSTGIHSASEVAKNIYMARSSVMNFLDEQLGHIFISSNLLVLYILALNERNSDVKISLFESRILGFIGILFGIILGIGFIEGGSSYFINIPLTGFILYKLFSRERNSESLKRLIHVFLKNAILTSWIVVFFWVLKYGLFFQLSDLGF